MACEGCKRRRKKIKKALERTVAKMRFLRPKAAPDESREAVIDELDPDPKRYNKG